MRRENCRGLESMEIDTAGPYNDGNPSGNFSVFPLTCNLLSDKTECLNDEQFLIVIRAVNMLWVLIFIAALIFLINSTRKPKNYPPGPPFLPIVGSAPFVQSYNFHFYLEKIKEKYGSVVGFKFGPNYFVSVRGVKEVKEVLSREEFQGRPKFLGVREGIMFSDGGFWMMQRKFAIKHLREFGFGKKTVEHVVLAEAEEFFRNVLRKTDEVQVSGLFSVSTINVLWHMMAGQRFSHEDDDFKYLLDCLQKQFRAGRVTGGLLNAFPFLKKIFPKFEGYDDQQRMQNLLDEFLQKAIDRHRETKTEEPRDFMDVYLNELEKPDLHSSFSESTLRNVCVDLFSAGAESVGNSISFCLLYCVLYPEWQERIHQEISAFDSSVPYLSDKGRLPTVEAFLSEVTRCNTIASLTVPHKTLRDTELKGYFIPKDSWLMVSLWSVLQDEGIWKNPSEFRPDRFLDDAGGFRSDAGWLPAFGFGKRICPGEALAKNVIFVYFVALLREFKFSVPEGHPKPSTVCLPGFTNAPQPFSVKVTKRLREKSE